jgi:hypothetical protein
MPPHAQADASTVVLPARFEDIGVPRRRVRVDGIYEDEIFL